MKHEKQAKQGHRKKGLVILLLPLLLLFAFFRSSAAPGEVGYEPESGVVLGNAVVIDSEDAAGGSYVEFGTSAVVNDTVSTIPEDNIQEKVYVRSNESFTHEGNKDARVALKEVRMSRVASPAVPIELDITIDNLVPGADSDSRSVYLVMYNDSYTAPTPTVGNNVQAWASDDDIRIKETLTISPDFAPPGEYKVALWVAPLGNSPSGSFRFSNPGVWDASTGWNNLGLTLTIVEGEVPVLDQSLQTITYSPENDEFTQVGNGDALYRLKEVEVSKVASTNFPIKFKATIESVNGKKVTKPIYAYLTVRRPHEARAFPLDEDLRDWPINGDHIIESEIPLPTGHLDPGVYDLKLWIPPVERKSGNLPNEIPLSFRLSNQNVWDKDSGENFLLGEITIK